MVKRGVTLIELIVVIAVSLILTVAVTAVLRTGFDIYSYSQGEILLEKALDETIDEISGSGFRGYGIKDAIEISDISSTFITFVPMWIDDSHISKPEFQDPRLIGKSPITLNRPLLAGAALPIAEVTDLSLKPSDQNWKQIPINFVYETQQIFLTQPLDPGSKIRFIFEPDSAQSSDCAETIKWQKDKIIRVYNGETQTIPRYNIPGVVFSGFKLQYFDNTNREIEPLKENIPNITGVKINISVKLANDAAVYNNKGAKQEFKEAFTFINLRNTRSGGRGLLIQKGTRISIPESKKIKMFSLANISGIKENGGEIELEAKPEKGSSWKAVIELGFDNHDPVIKKYSIEYPSGNTIYSETVNLTVDSILNFMNLAPSASYGFHSNDDIGKKTINVKGDVELTVTKMDAKGAMLFIRP